MKNHIQKKMIKFTIILIILVAIIFLGTKIHNNKNFSVKGLFQQLAYFRYNIKYWHLDPASASSKNLAAIPVLLYHGITNTPGKYNITQKQFAEQMKTLKKAGYSTISLEDFEAFENGEKELPAKSFLLTFDDGRNDSYLGADPILKALDYQAVMFVPTSDIGAGGYYLSDKQLSKMVKSGRWELGSHAMQQTGDSVAINASGTRADFLSNRKWLADQGRLETEEEYAARIDQELSESKQLLEKDFGIKVTAFAYPSSDYGQQSTNNQARAETVIKKYIAKNYLVAFQQVAPADNQYTLNYPGDDPLYLHRIEPENTWNGEKIVQVIQRTQTKSLPDQNLVSQDNFWKQTWGNIFQEDGVLKLTSTLDKSGSGAFLDGTKGWKNYSYQTTISGNPVEAITLYARYQDSDNTLACTFTDKYVKITQTLNGQSQVLDEVRYEYSNNYASGPYGVSVTNQGIICKKNGTNVLSSRFDPKLKNGGIGVSVWDSVLKNRVVIFSKMSATNL